ncbi:MAG: methyltransferase domain-containing protein [Desulfobacteraceae bacterium]|nr:methyltransferase domain-containing protein [Desulfobacteraceae bacterium]
MSTASTPPAAREETEETPSPARPRTDRYDASSITVLSGLEAVRQNPGMYIGSTDLAGLHHLVYELVDNAIDESQAGYCQRISVTLWADGSCAVEDDGRGIPVDLHPLEGRPACEVVLTKLHAGGKFKRQSYQYTAGLHGVGLSCLNALSEWLVLEVWRDGFHYRQPYAAGQVAGELAKIGPSDRRGTRITFRPDPRIFGAGLALSAPTLVSRLRELSFLNPGLHIRLLDQGSGEEREFQYDSGIAGFLRHLNQDAKVLHPQPLALRLAQPGVDIEVVMQWTAGYGENILSYVNSINTVHGGTHLSGLKNALTRTVNRYASEIGILKAENGEHISTFDILEGLTAVLSVRMETPSFEGQTKTRVTNPELKTMIDEGVSGALLAALRADSRLAAQVVARALDASRARLAARRASERIRIQSVDTRVSKEVYQRQFGIRSQNWHQSAVWIANHALLAEHVQHLPSGHYPRMLDVCCGSGVVGASFKGRVGTTFGLDLTPEMIALARTRLDHLSQGTVYQLPFRDNTFDLVVNREVLHLLPNPERPVDEIFRVLKPGGLFIVGQILPFGPEDAAWMYRVFKKKQPLIFNMFQEDDFRELLLGAGLVDLTMSEYRLWESIDVWIDTHETTNLHRHEIRELFYQAPQEVREVHPFEILPTGEIRDLWRWCVFSARKP